MPFRVFLILISGILFTLSGVGYLLTRLFLRPRGDSELDECYWEFEDTLPQLQRYHRFSRITFTGVILSMLLLFIAIAI